MADKKNLCAQIDTALHARVRQEQEQSGKTLSEFVEQLITDYYKMKEGTKMTGDMRTMAIQLPEELFERLKAHLKKNNLKQKQFIIGLIEDALEEGEAEGTAAQPEAEEPDEPDENASEEEPAAAHFLFGGDLIYSYPDNLNAKATLWLWQLRDLAVIGIGLLIAVLALTQLGLFLPMVLVAAYAFLSIHLDGLSVLDFLSFVVSFYITEQQIFEWEDPT